MGRCPVRPWAPGRKLGQRDRCRVEPRLQRLFRHRLGQRPDMPASRARRRQAPVAVALMPRLAAILRFPSPAALRRNTSRALCA